MADDIRKYQGAVDIIKTAILQSQARAARAVYQEQLALYFGIDRYVSANSRNKNWGTGTIETISEQLRKELPGLCGFSARNIKNMRTFFEEWHIIEQHKSAVVTADFTDDAEIRQLQLANLPNFPLREFISISFTHHIAILTKAKTFEERVSYMKYADGYKPTVEDLEKVIKQDLYHHQDKMSNNFLATIPDYKKAYRAIRMFKDEYLLDFINVKELGLSLEEAIDKVYSSDLFQKLGNAETGLFFQSARYLFSLINNSKA